MAYAAAPAAQPIPGDTAAPAAEGKAPPTIDSHAGRLSPLSVCYADAATSFLLIAAILSTLAPRRLPAGPFTEIGWTRLLPGILVCTIIIWNGLNSPIYISSPQMEAYMEARQVLLGLVFAFAVLNLLSDFLLAPQACGILRGSVGMGAAMLGLLPLMAFGVFDWMDIPAKVTAEPVQVLMWLSGFPIGVGLVFLWRRFNGWVFQLVTFLAGLGGLFLGSALPGAWSLGAMGLLFVTFTVAAGLGLGLMTMGLTAWQGLSGRAPWVWAWLLRAGLVGVYASC